MYQRPTNSPVLPVRIDKLLGELALCIPLNDISKLDESAKRQLGTLLERHFDNLSGQIVKSSPNEKSSRSAAIVPTINMDMLQKAWDDFVREATPKGMHFEHVSMRADLTAATHARRCAELQEALVNAQTKIHAQDAGRSVKLPPADHIERMPTSPLKEYLRRMAFCSEQGLIPCKKDMDQWEAAKLALQFSNRKDLPFPLGNPQEMLTQPLANPSKGKQPPPTRT